jgi:hypothetical protein
VAGIVSPSAFCEDRRRQRAHRLEQERDPVERVGGEAARPGDHREHDASPSARAVASTVAATIAGRAVRSDTRQIVRQRLTPSAAEPSATCAGPRPARALIATMIGRIITVRISVATSGSAPFSCTT